MRLRPLGKTGIEVSELSLGTWGLSGDGYGPVAEAEVDRTIARALALGITTFETADVYGRGEMERRLGNALRTEAATRPASAGASDRSGGAPAAAPTTEAKTSPTAAGDVGPSVAASDKPPAEGQTHPGATPSESAATPSEPAASAPAPAATEPPTTCVVTKIGTDLDEGRKRFDAEYLRKAIERSRERLGRERLDVVLLHNPTLAGLGAGEAVALLKELRGEGRIRAWGVSAGSVEVARSAMERGAEVLELAYNVFAARDLHELAAEISAQSTGVLARSVLAHGLLTGQWGPEREFYAGDHRVERWQPAELKRRIAQLDAMRPLVNGPVHSLRALAVRFALANHLVSSVVLGPRAVAQLEQLVREAGAGPPYLRDSALADLTNRLKTVGVRVA